ncbi:MAG: hypothetical protein MUP41_12425 [Desulfobacterales bacterium]|nr:hypothetical protein [Desulfobacterales bacterium]
MMKNKLRIFFLWSLAIFILASCLWFQSSQGFDQQAVAELEEYLIDFSKKIEGHRLSTGPIPSDLNAKKFISILEQYYPDKEIIRKVSKYPVRVYPEDNSYVLILCDQESKFILYKDLGRTITFIDYPYWREGKKVPCNE